MIGGGGTSRVDKEGNEKARNKKIWMHGNGAVHCGGERKLDRTANLN